MGQMSPDGKWRWDGSKWVAVALLPVQPSGGVFQQIPGLRTGAPWKLAVGLFAALLLIAAISSASKQPPTTPTGHEVAQLSSSPTASVAKSAPSRSPSPLPSPTPSPSPKAAATSAPPAPAPAPPPPPAPAPAPNTCGAPANPWGYNFCGGNLIYSPPSNFCSYFNCIPSFWKSTNGYVDQCKDGTYSHSGGRSGACSSHTGELRPLYSP
jgi:hypothetical protein